MNHLHVATTFVYWLGTWSVECPRWPAIIHTPSCSLVDHFAEMVAGDSEHVVFAGRGSRRSGKKKEKVHTVNLPSSDDELTNLIFLGIGLVLIICLGIYAYVNGID